MYKEGYDLHDELLHETLRPIDDPAFADNVVGIPRDSQGQHLAIMRQIPQSSLIVRRRNGRGTWARDLEIICLPHLFYHWRQDHRVAAILQCWLRMPSVSRGYHRAHRPRAFPAAAPAWEPDQAQGSSSSAPKAIAQPMALQAKLSLWRVREELSLWRVRETLSWGV
jgi:hypothetical protein